VHLLEKSDNYLKNIIKAGLLLINYHQWSVFLLKMKICFLSLHFNHLANG